MWSGALGHRLYGYRQTQQSTPASGGRSHEPSASRSRDVPAPVRSFCAPHCPSVCALQPSPRDRRRCAPTPSASARARQKRLLARAREC
eukprot:7274334-Prymnesium_polylepis.1